MKKTTRQLKIIDIINQNIIETQDELAQKLIESGYNVTQSTISRDIRELNLIKVGIANGRQRYAQVTSEQTTMNEKYARVLKDGYVSADVAENIIVIRTVSGMAMAVAAAIDALDFKEVLGCIAGDDTIFCAIRTSDDAYEVMRKLMALARH